MTFFALTLWAWEITGSATALALLGLFSQLPRLPISLFAGIVVDRYNRKLLMLLGDAIAALTTLTIGLLYLTESLQIWHLYAAVIVAGGFEQIQTLAYQASVSIIVPKQHYTRANSMASVVHYGANIMGPAVSGALYPVVGLSGIVALDLVTFAAAFLTLLAAHIPQPPQSLSPSQSFQKSSPLKQFIFQLTFGFRYVWQRPSLQTLLLITVMFTFAHDLGGAIYGPMILARTGGSAQTLASVSAMAGFGGVVGALVMSGWGGPKCPVNGMLAGYIGAGLSKIGFGMGRSLSVWLPTQVCSSLNFPLMSSAGNAIWMTQIPSEIQGRIFAANSLLIQGAGAIALLIAGPLADNLLEPAMMPDGAIVAMFSSVFGSGPGAGMGLLYTLCAFAMLLVGIGGFFLPHLKTLEKSTTVQHSRF